MITLEDLNTQVQSLTKQGKFQTAADIIADWAYWDMIGRYNEPPEPQEEISELPTGLLRDKVIGEFGVNWGTQTMREENDYRGEA